MKKNILLALCVFTSVVSVNSFADKQNEKETQQLEAQVEQLRVAMIDANAEKLKEVTSAQLNYGHSGGHVENQAEFVEKITSGRSDFVTIELKNQQIQFAKDVAIVRHNLVGTTNDQGKGPGTVDIGVLQIWQKQSGKWKLLARQAFKTPTH